MENQQDAHVLQVSILIIFRFFEHLRIREDQENVSAKMLILYEDAQHLYLTILRTITLIFWAKPIPKDLSCLICVI